MTRVLRLSQSIEIDQRPNKKFRQGFTGAPAAAGGSRNRQGVPLLPRPLKGPSSFLIWGEGRGVLAGWLRGLAHFLGSVVLGACAVPSFFSDTQCFLLSVGCFGLCVFWPRICPNCACTQLFQSHVFLCILQLQVRCVQVQTLQQRVSGPRPVSPGRNAMFIISIYSI